MILFVSLQPLKIGDLLLVLIHFGDIGTIFRLGVLGIQPHSTHSTVPILGNYRGQMNERGRNPEI